MFGSVKGNVIVELFAVFSGQRVKQSENVQ